MGKTMLAAVMSTRALECVIYNMRDVNGEREENMFRGWLINLIFIRPRSDFSVIEITKVRDGKSERDVVSR